MQQKETGWMAEPEQNSTCWQEIFLSHVSKEKMTDEAKSMLQTCKRPEKSVRGLVLIKCTP